MQIMRSSGVGQGLNGAHEEESAEEKGEEEQGFVLQGAGDYLVHADGRDHHSHQHSHRPAYESKVGCHLLEGHADGAGGAHQDHVQSKQGAFVALKVERLVDELAGSEHLERQGEEERKREHELAQQQRSSGDGGDHQRRDRKEVGVLREKQVSDDAEDQVDEDQLVVRVFEDAIDPLPGGLLEVADQREYELRVEEGEEDA